MITGPGGREGLRPLSANSSWGSTMPFGPQWGGGGRKSHRAWIWWWLLQSEGVRKCNAFDVNRLLLFLRRYCDFMHLSYLCLYMQTCIAAHFVYFVIWKIKLLRLVYRVPYTSDKIRWRIIKWSLVNILNLT
jgi:hypothetical protein